MEKTTASLEESNVSIYASDEINTRLTSARSECILDG